MKKIVLFIILANFLLSAQISTAAKSKLQSLILPGLGELKMGHEKKAQSFFIREAVLWLVCIGGKQASKWYTSDYRAFAELHADISMDGKDYIFAVNMGHYDNLREYNHTKSQQRQVDKIYAEVQNNDWQWDNTQNRLYFDKLRIQSVAYEKYSQFAIGGLVLHRIISLIDVIFLERQHSVISFMPHLRANTGLLQFTLRLNF